MPAKKKNTRPDHGAHSAAHTPPATPRAPAAAPRAAGPAAAIWAALTAAPGSTTAQIATAAPASRAVAGRELAALEAAGLARRTPGQRTGRGPAPAAWHPNPPAAQPGRAGDPPAGPPPALAGVGDLPAAGETMPGSSEPAAAQPGEPDGAHPCTSPAEPDPAPPGDSRLAPAAGSGSDPAASNRQANETESATDEDPAGPADGNPLSGSAGDAGDRDGGDSPGDREDPDPAGSGPQSSPAREAAALLRDMAGKATVAGEAADSGDTAAALAAMDAVCDGAAQARRVLKAAVGGRAPRGAGAATRPGQLRELVAAHLTTHRGEDFSPHQIGQALGRSSGAVANALDKLTALGQARLACEKPRRFQATPATTPSAATAR